MGRFCSKLCILCILIILSGCNRGKVNKVNTANQFNNYEYICIDGIEYIRMYRALSGRFKSDGTLHTCEIKPK